MKYVKKVFEIELSLFVIRYLIICNLLLTLNIKIDHIPTSTRLMVTTLGKLNHGHNILRLFDVLPNFPFTTSETKRDY